MSNFKAIQTYLNIRAMAGDDNNQLICVFGQRQSGKTKLLRSVEQTVSSEKPSMTVKYIAMPELTRRLVNAIYDGQLEDFLRDFENADLLLLDDVQDISGKKALERELVGIVKRMIKQKKQVIVSTRTAAEDMLHLDRELKRLLSSGVTLNLR
ncbi:MAG: ATP-binding protein [Oscillospiraceae bacterium]|nr:ATP-binding protein [Oscillospiraceae bacterium]